MKNAQIINDNKYIQNGVNEFRDRFNEQVCIIRITLKNTGQIFVTLD